MLPLTHGQQQPLGPGRLPAALGARPAGRGASTDTAGWPKSSPWGSGLKCLQGSWVHLAICSPLERFQTTVALGECWQLGPGWPHAVPVLLNHLLLVLTLVWSLLS